MSGKAIRIGAVVLALGLGVGLGLLLLRMFSSKERASSGQSLPTPPSKKELTEVILPTVTPHNTPTPGTPRLENPTEDYQKEIIKNQKTQGVATVNISDGSFEPAKVYLKKGGIVTWVNQDSSNHQIVGDSGLWGARKVLAKDGRFSQQFDVPGEYPYHCSLHPEEKGIVVVK